MSNDAKKPGSTGKAIEHAIEKALDPLASAIKRATQPQPVTTPPAAPGKPGLTISPLAVPFPAIPPIGGVEITTARAGFYKHERDDLTVFRFARGTTCAGVFTRHKVGSAPVDWCRRQLDAPGGGLDVRALVVNAGCANAFTGKAGADAARRTASEVAKRFGCRQRDVMLASTGVIGVLLDDKKIAARLQEVETKLDSDVPPTAQWAAAGRGIMTTDTFPKGSYAEATIDGFKVRIAGIAKGSGMIAPDMATMLGFIVTDASIHPTVLRALLGLHVRTTFNSVTVDGDTSTNDTCLLFATGASGAPRIGRVGDRRLKDFSAALDKVMLDLAHQLVRDGEGATKFVRVTVDGAASPASARKLAKSIADSPLVKTAIAGEDANWGRVVMAVGKTDEPVDRDRLAIRFGPHVAAVDGAVSPTYDEAKMSAYMKNAEIDISVDVGSGRASATVWTCDLTKGYIEINGDYRS
ncbi:MAG: bifunctional ornithine acetyltransferase/N-acetylglutamate synthase [Brevundimonas subvibrioides]|uniref:Arginine biosynthesis bifunctional protein ArgJ n=1 Tax=Brevundimonas subvibrioides TaxID=74313 RepID=A0A258HE67_9CAUL|nr:bifunctional glutamate N-acetyltransferase/amino-acid acetyltransferase ArgJ [Brevundimonas subvibrioides]OYX55310.1 MAG: bifunctional ornithine acetyltransferase/N-acetylglutamate synthase [Brevundimonas subvibrioides]